MSLHISLSKEALGKLERQKRFSVIFSVLMALSFTALLLLCLGLMFMKSAYQAELGSVRYIGPAAAPPVEPTPPKMTCMLPAQPSQASAASLRLLVAQTNSSIAMPTPEETSMAFSHGSGSDDFGNGWAGDSQGAATGLGGGGGFGSSSPSASGLRGTLIDFKQKPNGKPVKGYDVGNEAHFIEPVSRLQRADFSDAALRRHYQAPQELFLNHLAIGLAAADSGPKQFGAEKEIRPSGWLAHYRGRVTAQRSGSYRFLGHGDDYLAVYLNGKARLHAHWPQIQNSLAEGWKGTETPQAGPFNARMIYGDWFKLEAGDRIEIAIAIGERPGGKVGFVLQVEEQGQSYRTDALGRAVLPLFQLAPISEGEKSRIIKEFGSYQFEWENIPFFPLAEQ